MGDISHSTSISTRAIGISEQKQSGHISAKAIGISWQMTLCNLQSNLHSRYITPSSNALSLHTDNVDEQDHFPLALLHKAWALVSPICCQFSFFSQVKPSAGLNNDDDTLIKISILFFYSWLKAYSFNSCFCHSIRVIFWWQTLFVWNANRRLINWLQDL